MFDTKEIEVFLQKVTLGADDEKRTAKCLFYKTPVSFELAKDAHPHIADRLFRKNGSKQEPCLDVTSVKFGQLAVPNQNLEFYPHPDMKSSGGVIQNVVIDKVHALKLYADNPAWTLAWNATFEIGVHAKELKEIASLLVIDLLKSKLFVTMSPVPENQKSMFPEPPPAKCEIGEDCSEPVTWIGKDGTGWCETHVHACQVEVEKIPGPGKSESPAGTAAKEQSEKADEGRAINQRASQRTRKGKGTKSTK